jgi:benzodiazapine receptor
LRRDGPRLGSRVEQEGEERIVTNPSKRFRAAGGLSALASVALALAAGAIGGLATASSVTTWYPGLNKPAFNPPNAAFGPVWTILYVVMGLAAWRVWRAPATATRRAGLVLYGLQLILNLAWSLIFFGLRQPGPALLEIFVLLAALLAATSAFWRTDRVAGAMMVPYAAWVAFATLLNWEIWRLN